MLFFLHCSPTKSTFIKAKYQRLAFVPRLPCKDDDTITVSDLSQVIHVHVCELLGRFDSCACTCMLACVQLPTLRKKKQREQGFGEQSAVHRLQS